MLSNKESNLANLELVSVTLGKLLPKVTFVGGATTVLLVDEPAHFGIRRTDDVDVVVNVATLMQYEKFGMELRNLGFKEDIDGPICRWKLEGELGKVKLDVVPVEKHILGFSNIWYAEAVTHSDCYTLPSGSEINVITPAYFLATKFEAFSDRGRGNYFSHDLEDIVFVMENRSDFISELSNCAMHLKSYLAEKALMLMNDNFYNVLPGLLNNPDSAEMVRKNLKIMSKWV